MQIGKYEIDHHPNLTGQCTIQWYDGKDDHLIVISKAEIVSWIEEYLKREDLLQKFEEGDLKNVGHVACKCRKGASKGSDG